MSQDRLLLEYFLNQAQANVEQSRVNLRATRLLQSIVDLQSQQQVPRGHSEIRRGQLYLGARKVHSEIGRHNEIGQGKLYLVSDVSVIQDVTQPRDEELTLGVVTIISHPLHHVEDKQVSRLETPVSRARRWNWPRWGPEDLTTFHNKAKSACAPDRQNRRAADPHSTFDQLSAILQAPVHKAFTYSHLSRGPCCP